MSNSDFSCRRCKKEEVIFQNNAELADHLFSEHMDQMKRDWRFYFMKTPTHNMTDKGSDSGYSHSKVSNDMTTTTTTVTEGFSESGQNSEKEMFMKASSYIVEIQDDTEHKIEGSILRNMSSPLMMSQDDDTDEIDTQKLGEEELIQMDDYVAGEVSPYFDPDPVSFSSQELTPETIMTVINSSKEKESGEPKKRKRKAEKKKKMETPFTTGSKMYPEPPIPLTHLITMALTNSKTGELTVSDIQNFICTQFPFFSNTLDFPKKLAGVLTSMKSFCMVGNSFRTQEQLWSLKSSQATRMTNKVVVVGHKNEKELKDSMAIPQNLELILQRKLDQSWETDEYSSSSTTEDDGAEEQLEGIRKNMKKRRMMEGV